MLNVRQWWVGADTAYAYEASGRVFGHRIKISGQINGDQDPTRVKVSGVRVAGLRGSSYPSIDYIFDGRDTSIAAYFSIGSTVYGCRGPQGVLGERPITMAKGVTNFDEEVTAIQARGLVGGLCAALIEAAYPHIGPP